MLIRIDSIADFGDFVSSLKKYYSSALDNTEYTKTSLFAVLDGINAYAHQLRREISFLQNEIEDDPENRESYFSRLQRKIHLLQNLMQAQSALQDLMDEFKLVSNDFESFLSSDFYHATVNLVQKQSAMEEYLRISFHGQSDLHTYGYNYTPVKQKPESINDYETLHYALVGIQKILKFVLPGLFSIPLGPLSLGWGLGGISAGLPLVKDVAGFDLSIGVEYSGFLDKENDETVTDLDFEISPSEQVSEALQSYLIG